MAAEEDPQLLTAGSTATPGGKGGGIIIIVCDTLKRQWNKFILRPMEKLLQFLQAGTQVPEAEAEADLLLFTSKVFHLRLTLLQH